MRVNAIVTQDIEEKVAALLIIDSNLTAKYIKSAVEQELKTEGKSYQFTERTYSNIKNKILPKLRIDNPLEQTWYIGACKANNIPSNIIPFLIELLQIHWKRATYGDHDDGPSKITVRQAMWISTIWSSVGKLVERYKKDDEIPDPAGHRPKYFIFSPEYASKAIPFLVAQL